MERVIFSSPNTSTESIPQTPLSSLRLDKEDGSVPLVISWGDIIIDLSIPEREYFLLETLRDEFVNDERATANKTATIAMLTPERVCLRFVHWVIRSTKQQSTSRAILSAFEERFLTHADIHTIATQSSVTEAEEKELLRLYYSACALCTKDPNPPSSALLDAALTGRTRIFAVFGGQGPSNATCLNQLQEANRVYGSLISDAVDQVTPLLECLSSGPAVTSVFEGCPIRVREWIDGTVKPPPAEKLATAPYSLPLIAMLSLCQYVIACKVANLTPGEMRSRLAGVSGHSQGIAIATLVAVSDSWEDFRNHSATIMELIFWTGFYSQASSPRSPLPERLITDSVDHGEGEPASLLSVRGLRQEQIDALVATVNSSLPPHEWVHVALRNTFFNFVLAGPPHSLHGINKHIRALKADAGEDQSRIQFDKRRPVVYHQYMPVSAPFHTKYLVGAAERIKIAISPAIIEPSSIVIPVFETKQGTDLRQLLCDNVLHKLIDNICTEAVDWPTAIRWPRATHIVTFDAGGIGNLISQMKEGSGVRIVLGSDFGRSDDRFGRKPDLLSPSHNTLSALPQSWLERFAPRVEKLSDGEERISTKLTRLLGLPHVTVAAMTPTTVPWDMVSAVMNAGYHVELAGGGYYNDESMTSAIRSIVASVPSGRGITCNIIYSSPHSVSWQVSMVRRLIREGVPIDGLSIGAGVPSPEVMKEYITTLGLRHITLKPGSYSAIKETIAIAAMYPKFPIILQWTGGRGGGHHSYEDFHDPILELYAEIRNHDNLILVAGSGFGSAEETYPYLTGTWSVDLYDRSAMPFDGILLGSRMMVATEAHTSPQAKALICACPGSDASHWSGSYDKPVGGIITVKSEMGQPIHKIATRGVMFWAEMDKIFALPPAKMAQQVHSRKAYIIDKLNADFAKPYFGQNSLGQPVDVSEMTYAEVIQRMVDLMYVRHQSRWIHETYETFVCDMVRCAVERLGNNTTHDLLVASIPDPPAFCRKLAKVLPDSRTNLIDPDDEAYFLSHCGQRGQKPVNFVPVIDEQLEHWMKKDSLWQSEDNDAIIDQDVQRICVLQGPVAARFSTRSDESAKEILDRICTRHTAMLKKDQGAIYEADDQKTLGDCSPALQALCSEEFILRGSFRVPNPLRRVLKLPSTVMKAHKSGAELTVSTGFTKKDYEDIEVKVTDDKHLVLRLNYRKPGTVEISNLIFEYIWHAERFFCQIEEQSRGRNLQIKQFYRTLWLRDAPGCCERPTIALTSTMADKITKTIKMADAAPLRSDVPTDLFPLDGLIMISWRSIVEPLLTESLDGDLLDLVHLSNKTEYLPTAQPLKIGDVVTCASQISSISITTPGKRLEIRAEIMKSGRAVAVITSEFLFRGSYNDFDQTFRKVDEPDIEMTITSKIDDAVLKDREWFMLDSPMSLVGKTLVFRLRTACTWKIASTFSGLWTSGIVFEKTSGEVLVPIGHVSSKMGQCNGNPVTEYLKRRGQLLEHIVKLKQPGWDGDASYQVRIPSTNESYSIVSSDCNPIHTAPAIAAWADLPGTITHGMYTSAVVRTMMESIICNGDRKRFRSFACQFTGMVIPGDLLHVRIQHVAMQHGCKVFDVRVTKDGTGEHVLDGQATIEEVSTTFIFTGQGSQSKGMGMQLYASSSVARKIWDDADKFLLDTYGWSIIKVVRENPTSLTVHFGGKRGREIRKNYLSLVIQNTLPDGTVVTEPILKSLTPTSTSYTFSEPRGLLFSTQFAQPAITLVSKAAFEDLRMRGLVPAASTFAGHSLGEYGALAAFTDFIPFHTLMAVVFYRGLTMQVAMDRDEHGSTDFSMVAINPYRIGEWFDEASLRHVLALIAQITNGLLEIVNFNIRGEQYVAAGQLRNIHILTEVLNYLYGQTDAAQQLKDLTSAINEKPEATKLGKVIFSTAVDAQRLQKPFELARGRATIPLKGIDVPFHSTYLRPSVPAYRRYLEQKLKVEDIVPERFLNKFIPNVTADPFALDRDYLDEAAKTTGSEVLSRLAGTRIVSA